MWLAVQMHVKSIFNLFKFSAKTQVDTVDSVETIKIQVGRLFADLSDICHVRGKEEELLPPASFLFFQCRDVCLTSQ